MGVSGNWAAQTPGQIDILQRAQRLFYSDGDLPGVLEAPSNQVAIHRYGDAPVSSATRTRRHREWWPAALRLLQGCRSRGSIRRTSWLGRAGPRPDVSAMVFRTCRPPVKRTVTRPCQITPATCRRYA